MTKKDKQASTDDTNDKETPTDAPIDQPNDKESTTDNKPPTVDGYTPFEGISADDVADFIELKNDTGSKIGDIEDLDTQELIDLTQECRAWLKAGKPAAVMPDIGGISDTMQSLYRVRHHGRQFLYYSTEDSDPPVGIQRSDVYRTWTENGQRKVDRDVIVGAKDFYTIEYTSYKGKEFVERCMNESANPKFYIKEGGKTFEVKNSKVFNDDFDQLHAKATKGELL